MVRKVFLAVVVAGLLLPVASQAQVPTHVWSQRFGDFDSQGAYAVAVDPLGNFIVTGFLQGTMDVQGDTLHSAGLWDIFLLKFDADGNSIWSRRFGDPAFQRGRSVAVDNVGNIILAGGFLGSVDFGGGPLINSGSGEDIFVVKFDPAGNHIWSQRFGGPGAHSFQDAPRVSVDTANNIVLAGGYQGPLDFGGGPLASPGVLEDVFIAKFDVHGNHMWSAFYGDAENQRANGLACDAQGNVTIAGEFEGTVDFGGGGMTNPTAFTNDIFIAKFSPNGTHLWSDGFGDDQNQVATGIAVDQLMRIVVAGWFDGEIDFGDGALTSAGQGDIFVATFDANGTPVWSNRFGDDSIDGALAVDVGDNNHIVVAGAFEGDVDFGGGTLTSVGLEDIFVAEFDAGGAHLSSAGYGDWRLQEVYSVTVGVSGEITMAGWFHGVVDFGGGPLVTAGSWDVFLATLGGTPVVGVQPALSAKVGMRVYPNPFNPATQVHFSIDQPGPVTLSVYDVRGALISELVREEKTTGSYRITWDGRDGRGLQVASGIYFLRLESTSATMIQKITLLK